MSTAAPLTVGFWNCRVTVPIGEVALDLLGDPKDRHPKGILQRCQVLGLVEWGGDDREGLIANLAPDWDYAKPSSRSGSLVWDAKQFKLVRSHSDVAAEGRNVGRVPGLRMILKDYEVAVVTLRDITRDGHDGRHQRVTFILGHAPVWRPGGRAKMHADWLEAVTRLHEHYEAKGHEVYTLADFNRTPRHIRHAFAKVNAVSLWTARKPRATHHRRSIDDIYSRCRARRVALVDTASDHRAVLAVY